MYKIVSMVNKTQIKFDADLFELSQILPNSVYEPEQFPALFYRTFNPRITFAIFSTGKIMIYGGTKYSIIKKRFIELKTIINNNNINILQFKNPEICMLVAKIDVKIEIDFEEVLLRIKNIIYEPEQFPGIIWRYSEKIVVLLFQSGKIIVTGAKNRKQLKEITNNIFNIIK